MPTPSIDNPTREFYTFAGWTPEVAATVTKDQTYKATWTATNDVDGDGKPDETENKYTVTYKITENEVYKTFENQVDGIATPEVENPTRKDYIFIKWTPEVAETVTGEATVTLSFIVLGIASSKSSKDICPY